MIYDNATQAYAYLVSSLLTSPMHRTSSTSENTHETVWFDWQHEHRHVPFTLIPQMRPLAKTLPYLLAELAWMWSSDDDLETIAKFAPIWRTFSDDNKTVNSAYGARLTYKFGFDQYILAKAILADDNESRRAICNLSFPNPNRMITKDESCTVSIQFIARGQLMITLVTMRSNDIKTGFQFDIPYFASLCSDMASFMHCEHCRLIVTMGSSHMYNKDITYFKQLKHPEHTLDESTYINIAELIAWAHYLLHHTDSTTIISEAQRLGVLKGDLL